MAHSFIQKFLLAVLAGLCVATLISFYKNFVEKADRDLNEGFRQQSISGSDR